MFHHSSTCCTLIFDNWGQYNVMGEFRPSSMLTQFFILFCLHFSSLDLGNLGISDFSFTYIMGYL